MDRYRFPISDVRFQRLISRAQLNQEDVKILLTKTIDGMLVEMVTMMASGGEESHIYTAKVPKTWWDHFKKDVVLRITGGASTGVGKGLHNRVIESIHYETYLFEGSTPTRFCPHFGIQGPRDHIEFLTELDTRRDEDLLSHS